MNYKIHFSCISHAGNCRSLNQDNFICNGKYMEIENDTMQFPLSGYVYNKSPSIFGVFDGMGGEECGEIASFIAARRASSIMISKDAIEDILKYCLDVNEEICRYVREQSLSAMGTTAAMLVFTNKEIILCNIGDSKIFRFSQGTSEQISHDHVAVSAYGTKAPLSQNLGIPPTELMIEPYIARGKYNDGDAYLICSDGLTDMLKINELEDILYGTAFDEIAEKLLSTALMNGGKDNISILVCKMEHNARKFFKN